MQQVFDVLRFGVRVLSGTMFTVFIASTALANQPIIPLGEGDDIEFEQSACLETYKAVQAAKFRLDEEETALSGTPTFSEAQKVRNVRKVYRQALRQFNLCKSFGTTQEKGKTGWFYSTAFKEWFYLRHRDLDRGEVFGEALDMYVYRPKTSSWWYPKILPRGRQKYSYIEIQTGKICESAIAETASAERVLDCKSGS